MIIHASVKSKAFKRGWEKVVRVNGQAAGLNDFCGALHLDCQGKADAALLTSLYRHVFRFHGDENEKSGSIKVFDADGKEVLHYYQPTTEEKGDSQQ